MGGNALASFGARRVSADEYKWISNEALFRLKRVLGTDQVKEIPYYRKKESFGDCDIIVPLLKSEDYDKILTEFGDPPHVRNSNVLSALLHDFQIDIIPMPEEDYQTALTYYSYNDLGNLMGKLFHKFGLKYGHRGLTLPMRDGDNQYDELMVSKDYKAIFNFLDLDYRTFDKGFDTLEEIFEYVMSSRYFSPVPFQYENLNHTNRIRDRKRTTYHAFLEYIKGETSGYDFHENKDDYLPGIFNEFPGVKEQYEASKARLEYRIKVREHFNGHKVSEWTGLENLHLARFMHQWKEDKGMFAEWVLRYTEDQLKQMALDRLDKFHVFQRMSTLDYPWQKINGKWQLVGR